MGPEQICSPAVDVPRAGFLVKPVHTQSRASPAAAAPVIALSDLAVGWGPSSHCGWHWWVLTESMTTGLCCHMWESPSCRNLTGWT